MTTTKRPRAKAKKIETTELCKYGCGNVATYINNSGNYMCSDSSNKCSANKYKNSCGINRSPHKRSTESYKQTYSNLSPEIKRKMNWNRGLTKETSSSVAKYTATRLDNFKSGKTIPHKSGVAVNPKYRFKKTRIQYTDSFDNWCTLDSKHEWKVANELDKNGIRWTRPTPLLLSDGRRYEPDFYLVDYDVFLDPKTIWMQKFPDGVGKEMILNQQKQLEKIEMCRKEHNVKIVILYSTDKRSFYWDGIFEIINFDI